MKKKEEILLTFSQWMKRWGINFDSYIEGMPLKRDYFHYSDKAPINERQALNILMYACFRIGMQRQRDRVVNKLMDLVGN